MGHPLKSISKAGIPEAIAKAELYRYLNEPEETESICRDILAIEPGHQLALRMLGLSLTDQFIGAASDRYMEVQSLFLGLRDPYEQLYYTGLESLRPIVGKPGRFSLRAGARSDGCRGHAAHQLDCAPRRPAELVS